MLSFDLIAVEVWLLVVAVVILFLDMFFTIHKKWIHRLCIFSFFIAIAWLIANFFLEKEGFYGFVAVNSWNSSLKILLLLATAICVLLSPPILKENKIYSSEFYFLILVVLVSMLLLISSFHLFFIYICLESVSITSFLLCTLNKNNKLAVEGGMKYFLLNAFSSAILLYGITFLFGTTGSFDLREIYTVFSMEHSSGAMTLLGIFFLLVGFGFKISLAPFHMWTPDVYQSSSLTVTAFFSTPVKIAFVAAFVKICVVALAPYFHFLQWILGILFVLTLLLGNTLALVQKNIKRMLAYSSISHAGFFMLGLLNIPTQGIASLWFYFIAYVFSSLGVFTCLACLVGKKEVIELDDLKGLASKHPVVSSALIFFLFSLAGLPVTAGFIAKLTLFYDGLKAGYFGLVALGLLASVISAGYYLKIGVKLFSSSVPAESTVSEVNFSIKIILFFCTFILLLLGIYPSFLDWNLLLFQGRLPHPFL
jgi:NADH-quinone oxidoreductase subunit N